MSSGVWGAADTTDATVRAQEKPRSSNAMDTSTSTWGDTPGGGWGSPAGGAKSPGRWGASGTIEMTSVAQPKRNDADQENHRFKPSPVPAPPRPPRRGSRVQDDEEETRPKMTGTNDVPMVNTRWNKKADTTVPPHVESSERSRLPPLQTSALNNATPREPQASVSANRSEDDRMDVDGWRQDVIPEKVRDRSPSISTVTGPVITRKRKYGNADLERKQDIWKDFIRCVKLHIHVKHFIESIMQIVRPRRSSKGRSREGRGRTSKLEKGTEI